MGGTREWTLEECEEFENRLKAKRRRELTREHSVSHDLCIELITVIQEKIIRPGPKPEERQCFDVANELTLIESELAKLIHKRIFQSKRVDATAKCPHCNGDGWSCSYCAR